MKPTTITIVLLLVIIACTQVFVLGLGHNGIQKLKVSAIDGPVGLSIDIEAVFQKQVNNEPTHD